MIRVFEDIFHIALGEVLVSHVQIVQGETIAVGQQNAHTGLSSYPAIGVTVFVERNDAVFFDERAVGISELPTGHAFAVAVKSVAVGSKQDFAVFSLKNIVMVAYPMVFNSGICD